MPQRFRLAAAVLVVACRPLASPIWSTPDAEARVTCDERAKAERRWVELAEACEIAGVRVPAGSRVLDDGEGRWQIHAPQTLVIDGVPCDAWREISLAGRRLAGCWLRRGSRVAGVRLRRGFAVELHASGALREGWLVGVRRFDGVVVRGRVQLTEDGHLEEGELAWPTRFGPAILPVGTFVKFAPPGVLWEASTRKTFLVDGVPCTNECRFHRNGRLHWGILGADHRFGAVEVPAGVFVRLDSAGGLVEAYVPAGGLQQALGSTE